MTKNLEQLIEKARKIEMSPRELEEQRRSFAFGSAKIENDDITRRIIDEAADRLEASSNGT